VLATDVMTLAKTPPNTDKAWITERRRLDDTITKAMITLDGVTPAPGDPMIAELRAYRKSAVKALQSVGDELQSKCPMPAGAK
jgi:hypothetical protein